MYLRPNQPAYAPGSTPCLVCLVGSNWSATPASAESWRNLAVLLWHQGRMGEAAIACLSGLVHCPDKSGLVLLHECLLHE